MTGVIATIPRIQFSTVLGLPLVGGKLYTYAAGSTTPATTYQDQDLTIENENPITLDSTGSCVIWLDSTKSYKFMLKSVLGVIQPGWPVDNISGAANAVSLAPTLSLYAKLATLAGTAGSALIGFLQAGIGAISRTVQDKLRDTVSVKDFGAIGDGVTDDSGAFQAAVNACRNRLLHVPAGTYFLSTTISAALTIGQDFVIIGDGPEVSRLVFGPAALNGISVTYSTSATNQAQGDKTAIHIEGLDVETQSAGGGSAIRLINSPPAGQINETQIAPTIKSLRINGATSAAYWDTHIELENVTYADIRDVTSQDAANRGIGISLNSTGSYAAVEFAIDNYRANAIGTALKVRGKCEGVYASDFVAVGGVTGVDWVATPVAGGKKPLLLLTSSHINVSGTAVKAVDVSQVIGSAVLIYVTNSTTTESIGFDFQATGALSNENHQVKGVTIVGQGDRTGSLAKGVKLGTNVIGCVIDGRFDNLGTGIFNQGGNNFIAPGSKFSYCNARTAGFADLGWYGETGTTANVDASLQREFLDGSGYARDQGREQLRVETFTYMTTAASETFTRNYARPFLIDTIVVVASFGEAVAGTGLSVNTAASTKDSASFSITGATPGSTYRINYIAYGY